MNNAQAYIKSALAGFDMDPADSDFQRGYEAALRTVLNEAFDPIHNFNRLETEAALCVWEELLLRHENSKSKNLNDYWDSYGSSQVRQDAIDIGVWVENVWIYLQANNFEHTTELVCFDWDFIPRLIDQLDNYWSTTQHMYQRDGKFPTPTVQSAAYHYLLAYGVNV